nr:hypothetical protein [Duncaniella muris]
MADAFPTDKYPLKTIFPLFSRVIPESGYKETLFTPNLTSPNLTGQLKINLPLQFRNLALRNRIGSLAAWLKGR